MRPMPKPSMLASTAKYLPPVCLRNTNTVEVFELVTQIATAVLLEFQRPASKALLITLEDRLCGKALRTTTDKAASGRDWASEMQTDASIPISVMSIVRFTLPNVV